MRSLTSLHESRVHGPQNFWSPVQNDFCNKIGPKRRKTMSALMSAIGDESRLVVLTLSFVNPDPERSLRDTFKGAKRLSPFTHP
jgi:hypothetical protein